MKGKSKKSTYSTTFGVDPKYSASREDEPAHRAFKNRFRGFRNTVERETPRGPVSGDVPRQRFELRLDEPKSPVLPLHHQGVQKNGDDEIRTHDPHNAIVVLFQLSYVPVKNYSPNRAIIGAVVNAFFSFFATVRIFSKDCLFFSVFSCFAAGCGRGGAQC